MHRSERLGSTVTEGSILVVEDEPNARTALAEILGTAGYSVETASDGVEALSRFDALAPDVVLTDLKLPGADGLDVGSHDDRTLVSQKHSTPRVRSRDWLSLLSSSPCVQSGSWVA